MTPRLRDVEIVNKCISGREKPPTIGRVGHEMKFLLGGGATRRGPVGPVTVVRPGLFFADACRTSLSAKGVKIDGLIRKERLRLSDGSLPGNLDVIAVHRTPIADVVTRANRDSQNYFAECLMKRAGFAVQRLDRASTPTGSWSTGQEAVKRVLGRVGIDPSGLVIADGSGLSHDSRVTPMAITEVLLAMRGTVAYPTFRDSLAESGGEAGTLSKRMRDIRGKVRAKTGYITGVRTMSGYVEGLGGRLFAFSILFNGVSGSTGPINDCHDRVCRLLASTPLE
jgi:D-alanyl-D-alanine carboxypeptidase/D-alanyl-D-alanine-endopeptidase (penicillin-binding protein 4)